MIALHREADRGWMADAACRNRDPEMWFPLPTKGGRQYLPAVAICNSCPVKERCADYADSHREQHGVWGGLNVEQRNRRARQRVSA